MGSSNGASGHRAIKNIQHNVNRNSVKENSPLADLPSLLIRERSIDRKRSGDIPQGTDCRYAVCSDSHGGNIRHDAMTWCI
jgi:hypothetical protein